MDSRTPLVVVAGRPEGVRNIGAALLGPGTVSLSYDLAMLSEGVVARTVRTVDGPRSAVLELAHGCVSCTLRQDLLPLLRALSSRSSVSRIVLLLDPLLEPAQVCRAVQDVVVAGVVGRVDAPASRDVRIAAVLTAIDADSWLDDATGDATIGVADDERTVAQLAVGAVESADALVVFGMTDPLDGAVTSAVLARLAPGVPTLWTGRDDDAAGGVEALLAVSALRERRAPTFDPHGPLLRGSPPLEVDSGVTLVEFNADRPFHPARLHEAVDVLLDGVVAARGRIWLATRPDHVLWLESAGGGLRIGSVDTWIAAMSPEDQAAAGADRLALAAMRWHPDHGDRHNAVVALTYDRDPGDILRALQWALVTDEELCRPDSWHAWPDPLATVGG